ncbi:hypothetical protein Elgi_07940 [Paenibacillus elgii]|uniref:hypothetical protein n=1 Tax=Paenibacillus elgii TaxID=189691 RepID=UPI002D7B795A|nr:hypothetical protein Elgi_07940 [Paenibacillus elgii]
MSSDKTKRLGLNKWVGSDQVLRAEFNENFDKIDAYVDDSLAVKTTSVQLKQGMQVIDVNQSSPLNNVTIQGRTLVNLLGRTGGFEAGDIAQWLKGAATLTSDTSTFVSGLSSGKMTTTEAKVCFIAQRFTFKAGKYYILIAETKNGTATIGVRIGNNDAYSTWNTDATKWTTQFVKVKYEKDRDDYIVFNCSGAVGQTGFVDNYRVYEITRAEYDTIDSMTPEQIATKWPYVDDMKSVYSPYIIKSGENLLPPFTEWTRVTAASKATPTDPYEITFFANGDGDFAAHNFRCVPNTTYILKVDSLDNMYHGISKVSWSEAVVSYTTETSFTFNSGNNTELSYVVKAKDKSKIGSLTNPTLCLGAEAKSFKPCNDDYLFFPNVNLASTVDGMVYDTLYQRDGKYWKQTRFKSMDLDGSLPWDFDYNFTGYKRVFIPINSAKMPLPTELGGPFIGACIKYDGKILMNSSGIDQTDQAYFTANGGPYFKIYISNADSGWGDLHKKPSEEEVRAYFYGWVMYDANNYPQPYNGTGTKAWGYRDPYGASGLAGGTSTPPNFPAPGFTPYKLQYQLATPIVEEVASEGGITLREGLNQVEVGTGMIVREKANQKITGNYYAIINSNDPAYPTGSALKHRTKKILTVYSNERKDGKWNIDDSIDAIGKQRAWIFYSSYDPSASYTVTYLALDQYALTSNIQSIQAEYAGNIKSAVDTLAAGQSDIATRVGSLEITRAQRAQPQWIKPTLLNGWVNYGDGAYTDAGYFKDEFGIVHIRGLVKNGQLNASIFMLPLGYRPARAMVIPVATDGNGQLILGRLTIDFNGSVYHTLGGTGWFSLDGISFLAER